ncbi:UPF0705 protein C11orf49 [Nephila pilipes]|uniref:Centriolar satellite-associated tubulin polyglutamylase complex regulator 1 n=1 Tax=Nephila pilipes TaxID=299642 RepID=A0A8X6QY39_NEPPI|nr:UPF0705 protein C11orf49 [Nephila pilipes]
MDESQAETEAIENTKYLLKYNIEFYLEDAVAQLLTLRSRNEGYEIPEQFFMEYFSSVHKGTHVLLREFSFISATLYNRLCVVRAITLIYKPLLRRINNFDAKDYHSLIQLIWPTFPLSVVQSAFDLSEQRDVGLTFVKFLRVMKRYFCVGKFRYEEKIISAQIDAKIDEYSEIYKMQNEKEMNLSEADFLRFLQESGSDEAFLRTITKNIHQNVEVQRILSLAEVDSTSSDESVKGPEEKFPFSFSGTEYVSESEQNVNILEESSHDQAPHSSITSSLNSNEKSDIIVGLDSFSSDEPV